MPGAFYVRNNGKFYKVCLADIIYIEACKNYIKIFTKTNTFLVHVTLKEIEKLLPEKLFFRAGRSFIVGLTSVTAFDHEYIYLDKVKIHLNSEQFNLLRSNILIVGYYK